ncbi:MAG: ABC transporter permease [Flavobacteriaceae bacterium]
MKTIATSFIAQFFSHLSTVLLLVIFTLIQVGVLFIFPTDYNILQGDFADLDLYFTSAPIILIFLVPAIGMGSFAQEIQTGTLELLLTKPLNRSELIWGKFLGVFGTIVIGLIPVLLYAAAISSLSDSLWGFDWGQIGSAIIGLLFLTATFSAVVIWASLMTSRQVVALLLSVSINLLLWVGGELFSLLMVFNRLSDFFLELSLRYHFSQMAKGLFGWSSLGYFVFVGLAFLFAARLKLDRIR